MMFAGLDSAYQSTAIMIEATGSGSGDQFRENLERIRRGEPGAVPALIAKYEPYLRRSLRIRIKKASLQPIIDSVDVCQSVFCSFVLRFSAGEYEIESEEELRKLLFGIANNKFLMLQRREYTLMRQRDRAQSLSMNVEPTCPSSEDRTLDIDNEDFLNAVAKRFFPHEQELFCLRRNGMAWAEIAQLKKQDANLLRKQLSRAVQRIAIELGLEDDDQ